MFDPNMYIGNSIRKSIRMKRIKLILLFITYSSMGQVKITCWGWIRTFLFVFILFNDRRKLPHTVSSKRQHPTSMGINLKMLNFFGLISGWWECWLAWTICLTMTSLWFRVRKYRLMAGWCWTCVSMMSGVRIWCHSIVVVRGIWSAHTL